MPFSLVTMTVFLRHCFIKYIVGNSHNLSLLQVGNILSPAYNAGATIPTSNANKTGKVTSADSIFCIYFIFMILISFAQIIDLSTRKVYQCCLHLVCIHFPICCDVSFCQTSNLYFLLLCVEACHLVFLCHTTDYFRNFRIQRVTDSLVCLSSLISACELLLQLCFECRTCT